jgi:hypothetical protein
MLIAITVGAKNRLVENSASRKPRMRQSAANDQHLNSHCTKFRARACRLFALQARYIHVWRVWTVWVSGRRLYAAVAVAFLNFVLCGTFCHIVQENNKLESSYTASKSRKFSGGRASSRAALRAHS